MTGNAKSNKWLETLLAIVCIFAPASISTACLRLAHSNEFLPYYAASYLMQRGSYGQIYDTHLLRNIQQTFSTGESNFLPFVVSPVISWVFYPLAFLGFKQALYMWISILVFSIFAAYLLFTRFWGLRGSKKLWLAALFGCMGPLIVSISKATLIPVVLFAFTGLFINLKKRNFLMASVYQSLLWLQPHIVLPMLCFEFGLGQIYTVVITSLVAVIGILISCLLGGVGILNDWFQLFFRQIYNFSESLGSCTLQGELLRCGIKSSLADQISAVVYLTFLIGAFFIGKLVKKKEWDLGTVLTIILPLTIVLGFHAFGHDLLLLLPGIIFLMMMSINNWLKYLRASLIMSTLSILFFPFYILIISSAMERSIFNPFFLLLSVFIIVALVVQKYAAGDVASTDEA